MFRLKWLRLLAVFAMALAALLGSSLAMAQARFKFEIPAQPLEDSLRAIGRVAGVNVLFEPQAVKGREAQAVNGQFTAVEAINQVLRDTPLEARSPAPDSVVVKPRSAESRSDAKTSELGTPAGQAAGTIQLEGIVVTAQKRSQFLQDVPISISVLGGDRLDHSSVVGVTEALNLIPGVVATAVNQGGGTQVTMRGVGAAGPLFNGSSPIAYYLDSIPFGLVKTAIAPDANAFDLQRIEVLRGPQGTLYGASAQNGVVRVITNEANLDKFEMKARTSFSSTDLGGNNYRGDIAVNVPIVDGKLAIRAVVGYERLSGWIDTPVRDDVNDAKLRSFRLKVNAQPTPDLSIGLSAWSSRSDFGAPSASGINGRRSALISEPASTDYDAYGLKVGYQLEDFSLSSVTSYLDYKNRGTMDQIGQVAPGPSRPFVTNLDSKVFAQEILLNSTHRGPWRWSGGAIYRDAKDRLVQSVPVIFNVDFSDSSRSWAMFGEVGRRLLNDEFELALGLRQFRDEVQSRDNNGPYNPHSSFKSTTPRAVLTWYASGDLMAYASYSEGFRSGFPQNPAVAGAFPDFPPLEPDKLRNYEVGAKGNWWGGRLAFDAALYYIEWRGVQQTLNVPVGNQGVFLTALVNGESASGPGADLALSVRPVDGLELGASLSWNDLALDAAIFSSGILLFDKGDRLNYSSKYTGGAWADYTFPLGGAGLRGRLSASANYASKHTNHGLLGGSRFIATGEHLLITRASFSLLSTQRWTAMLYVDNIGNDQGANPSVSPLRPEWTPRVRPRTIGVQVDYRF